MGSRASTRWLVGAGFAAFIFQSASANGTISTMALEGDAALHPDLVVSGSYGDFLPDLQINNAGHVLFKNNNITGPEGGAGIFLGFEDGQNPGVIAIAREGSTLPGGTGKYGDFPIFNFTARLNDAGQVLFESVNLTETSGGTSDDAGLFLISPDFDQSTIDGEEIARKGQSAPVQDIFHDFVEFSLNNSGTVAFAATKIDNPAILGGIYRSNAGGLSRLVAAGEGTPGGSDFFVLPFTDLELNDSGQVAFASGLCCPGMAEDESAVFLATGTSITEIAREQQVNAFEGAQLARFGPFQDINLNERGEVAFRSFDMTPLDSDKVTDEGVFLYTGGKALSIAQGGLDGPPDLNGTFRDFGRVLLNDAGQVLFHAVDIAGTTGGELDDSGVFLAQIAPLVPGDVALSQIVREGQAAPDGNGFFGGSATFSGIDLNNGGQAAFVANLVGTSGGSTEDRGVFIADGKEVLEVVRKGDEIAGGVVEFLASAEVNDWGQVAFWAAHTDGTDGVFLFTPELKWRTTADGAWDDSDNWTVGLTPGDPHTVIVDPQASVSIVGPRAAVTVETLEIGAGFGRATLTLNGGILTAANEIVVERNGVLTGDGIINGSLTNRGEVRADNINILGNLTNEGLVSGARGLANRINTDIFVNSASGEMRVDPGESLRLSAGIAVVNEGRIIVSSGSFEIEGSLVNDHSSGSHSGQIFVFGDNVTLRFGDGLFNAGELNVTFGGASIFGDVNIAPLGKAILTGSSQTTFFDEVINGGELRVSDNAEAVFFGDVSGSGLYSGTGTKFYEGSISPGSSPGLVIDMGSTILGAGATFEMEVAGLVQGDEYDHYDVAGKLGLNGTLRVSLLDDFNPDAGDVFDFFDWGTLSGSFLDIDLNGAALPSHLVWDLSQLYSNGSLSVTAAPVPLPAGVWLLLSALGVLGAIRRTRAH